MGTAVRPGPPPGPPPRRWAHVQGVAAQARGLAPVLGTDADLLEAAAWLHDIGYAPGLAVTGLHALAGALPARRRTCRRPAVPPGRAPLLRHHRSRRTRTCRRPVPGVRACTGCAVQRADLLRHDHQPRRRTRGNRATACRDTRPLRPRAPGEPVDPARHADDPARSRAGPPQVRPKRIARRLEGQRLNDLSCGRHYGQLVKFLL